MEAVAPVAHVILPAGPLWSVHARGCAWRFPTLEEAMRFATAMAEEFALRAGGSTCVQLLEAGRVREIATFAGVVAATR
jgi:hypothetical protein